ncbi:hypothetical protein SHL15_4479 [Streptomyces hygroscopicus subsp. limoneus]|nr:hypothetical protein SHL15_4479 [Streptomyces hygroscopicus subsp. limoneus]
MEGRTGLSAAVRPAGAATPWGPGGNRATGLHASACGAVWSAGAATPWGPGGTVRPGFTHPRAARCGRRWCDSLGARGTARAARVRWWSSGGWRCVGGTDSARVGGRSPGPFGVVRCGRGRCDSLGARGSVRPGSTHPRAARCDRRCCDSLGARGAARRAPARPRPGGARRCGGGTDSARVGGRSPGPFGALRCDRRWCDSLGARGTARPAPARPRPGGGRRFHRGTDPAPAPRRAALRDWGCHE